MTKSVYICCLNIGNSVQLSSEPRTEWQFCCTMWRKSKTDY